MLVAGWVLASYSQKVIQLEETKLTFKPSAQVAFEDYSNGIMRVKENYARQFQSNAIQFMLENFDIYRFMRESGEEFDEINVTVQSSNGILMATYNEDGKLVKTFQKFKNVPLPNDIRTQVNGEYKNWKVQKNKYMAFGKNENLDQEQYVVYLKNGNSREKIKITPARTSRPGVAIIEKH